MKQFGFEAKEELVKSMIKNIDVDNNGTIELHEFLTYIEKYNHS